LETFVVILQKGIPTKKQSV